MDDVMPLQKKKMDLDVMPLTCCIKNLWSIDDLPDELLISILSCLNFHEAARTCILSRRWRYLWKHTTCSIQLYNEGSRGLEELEKFINSVNEVLKLHQGESIERFKVGFVYPSIEYGPSGDTDLVIQWHSKVDSVIDGWIKFAMEKKVKVFELDLAAGVLPSEDDTTYNIPHVQKLLSISGEVKLLRTLTTLKSFRFVNVRITREVVEFLLSHCPLLEQVCISASFSLEGVEVCGSLPKLRSMEISECDALKTMKIRAPGLVSFTYIGPAIRVPFKKVPLLSELTIGGDYAYSFIFKARKHSSYCRNLKKLKLEVSYELSGKCLVVPNEYPQLCNLNELELDITASAGSSLCFFTFLTKCSPQLSTLTIKLCFFWGFMQPPLAENHSANCDAREIAATFNHKCLEVVKFIGFIGCSSDYTLALHLLQIAQSLKKMILDSEGGSTFLIEKKAIGKCAKKLKANLPPGAKLLTRGPGFTRKLDDPAVFKRPHYL